LRSRFQNFSHAPSPVSACQTLAWLTGALGVRLMCWVVLLATRYEGGQILFQKLMKKMYGAG